MKHSRFGLILLLSSGAALACSGDPTEAFRGTPHIITTPSVLFVREGASTFLTVQLVDDQGNQLASTFDATSAGPQAAIVRDTTFLQTTNGTNLSTSDRFAVTAGPVGKTTITVTAGGQTADVPMTSVPTSLAATFSTGTPAANEELTITLPAGYKFRSNALVVTGADTGFVRSVSVDSTSANVLLAPGAAAPISLSGVEADFIPGVSLTVPTVDSIHVGPIVTPQSGTDSPGTAPVFAVPALGEPPTVFFDGGTFDYMDPDLGTGRLYKFTITTAGDYNLTVNWPTGEDLGGYYFLTDAATPVGNAADAGLAGAHPEKSTSALVPGTYLLAVFNFSETNPPWFSVQFNPAQ